MPRQAGLDAPETYITLLSEKQKSAGLLMIDWSKTQPHTLSPEPWALLRGVRLPGDWAFHEKACQP